MPFRYRDRRTRGRAALAAVVLITGSPLVAGPITEPDAIDRSLALPEFVSVGEANREEAEARVSGIRRFANPEVSVSRESISGDGRSETEWTAGVSQPLDLSGRRSRLRAAARAEVVAVGGDTGRRRQERVAEVRRAFATCAAAAERVELANAFTVRLREAERIIAERVGAGDAAGYDLRRLRVEARAAEAQATLQAGEREAACRSLSALTGEPDARSTVSIASLAAQALSPAGTNRPDLLAREQRLVAAGEEVRAARAARLPEVVVGAGYRQVNSNEGTARGPVVSLGMRVPLFDNGRAAVRVASARERAREAELGLARREVDASVAVAEARYEAAREAAERAQRAAEDAQRLGEIAEEAYAGGETGIVELIDAYRTARDAQVEIIDLLERAVRARLDLELAQGSLS